MHLMDPRLLFYVMLMIVSTGIQMKILENDLLTPWERDSMCGAFLQIKVKNRVFIIYTCGMQLIFQNTLNTLEGP